LEQKLKEIDRVSSLIEVADEKTKFLEKLTKNGGLFSASTTQTASTSSIRPGDFEWIVLKRRGLEQLAEELKAAEEEEPAFVLKPTTLNEILIDLETSVILSEDELSNRVLIFLTNRILGSEDYDQVSRHKAAMKKYAANFVI
jgi:hypothetical protein